MSHFHHQYLDFFINMNCQVCYTLISMVMFNVFEHYCNLLISSLLKTLLFYNFEL